MPKYWGKQIFSHGRFPEVGQKQKTEKKKKERKRPNDGNNNGRAMHGACKHAWRTQAGWAKRFHIIAGFRQGGANIMFPFYWNTESLRMSPNTMSKIKLKNFKYVIHTKASNFRSVALSDKFCFLLFHPWGDGAL